MVKIRMIDVLMHEGYEAEFFEREEIEWQDIPHVFVNEKESPGRFSFARGDYRVNSILFIADSPKFLVEFVSTTYIDAPWKLLGVAEVTGKTLVEIEASVMELPEQHIKITLPRMPCNTREYVLIRGRMYAVKEILYTAHNTAATCIFNGCYPPNYFVSVLKMYAPANIPSLTPFLPA